MADGSGWITGPNIAESWNGAPTTTIVGSMQDVWNYSSGSGSSGGDSSGYTTNPDGSTVSPNGMVTPPNSLWDVFTAGIVAGFKSFIDLFITKGIVLAVLLFFVDWVITFFLELIGSFLKMSDLSNMINQLPNKDLMGYFFYLGALDYGLPLVLSAYLLKFFIRRLPFVG